MSDEGCLIMAAVATTVIAFGSGFMVGGFAAERCERDNAVSAGVAEYYLNENNEKAFRYIVPESHTPTEQAE